MDKSLLQQNAVRDSGVKLNDEELILQDEKVISHYKNGISDKEKRLEESPEGITLGSDIEILFQESKFENDQEINKSQQNKKRPSDIEKEIYNTPSDELFDKVKHQKNHPEICLERVEPERSGYLQNIKSLEPCKTAVLENNSQTLFSNIINKNNVIKSENNIPRNVHLHCKDEKNREVKISEKQKLEENISYDEDTACGLGIFKPRWLQPYATAKIYLILYSINGILQGSYYSYLNGSISTLEKKFAFKSKTSGALMTADEIAPLLFGMFIGYYASRSHRPRLVALGILLSAGCCFCSALPYFIYGRTQNLMLSDVKNTTDPQYCYPGVETTFCDPDRPQNLLAVLILSLGIFLKGFGNLAFYTVGLAYMDDNSNRNSTPVYLAITFALRLLGPLVGYLMSSGFLKIHENPVYDPGYGADDPRWIGAWWMGFLLQGVLLVIFAIPIALFPRRLPGKRKVQKIETIDSEGGLKEICTGFVSAIKRLGRNPVFIVLIINTTMVIFGHFGHAVFLPKYMEIQFRLSASEASLYSGAITMVCIIISTLLGGVLMWKFRPTTKLILAGMITSEIIVCIGYFILIIPRCQTSEMKHFGMDEEGLILNNDCNNNCSCSTSSFTPFCGPDGKTLYFSPCYAGCTEQATSSASSKSSKEYSNCTCVDQHQFGTTISEGFCPGENCRSQVQAYLIIYFFMVTMTNFFRVAQTLILLRSVHPSDNSMALGTFQAFTSLFGSIPFPVTMGTLVDSACLVWEKSCGETGNCWFYDIEKYRYLMHGVPALFSFLSVMCIIALYCFSSRIRNLYSEEVEEDETKDVDVKLHIASGCVQKPED